MMAQTVRHREFTGWHMLAAMVAFFGIIIAVNLTMAYYANSTWSGLVVRNSYVASQHFNEQQAEARSLAALNWNAQFSHGEGRVTFRLADESGKPVAASGVRAVLRRPVNEAEDVSVALAGQGGGLYTADVSLKPGQWQVEVTADAGLAVPFRHNAHIVVKPGD